jgi:hypothetical protein
MKLFWHIGPHKTGTTSLQLALSRHAAAGHATYYYPRAAEHGPGHASIAWTFLGLNGRERNHEVVLDEVAEASRRGFDKVVLSSEEFARALSTDEAFGSFAEVCAQLECELVITLRPLMSRVYPELQELIKNGRKVDIGSSQEVLDALMTRPGLRPDFLPAAIFGSNAARVSVLTADADNPGRLFASMSTVLGETLPVPRDRTQNRSYAFVTTAWLDVLNRYGSLPLKEARDIVEAAYGAGRRRSKSLGKITYPGVPPALERYLEGTWELQMAFLRSLEQAGRIRWL